MRTPPSVGPGGLADEVDRHRRVDRLVETDLLEIDVRDGAADAITWYSLSTEAWAFPSPTATSMTAFVPADVVSAARSSRSRIATAIGASRP